MRVRAAGLSIGVTSMGGGLVDCALFEKEEAMCLGRDESIAVVAFLVFQFKDSTSVGSYQTVDTCTQVVKRGFGLYGYG